MTSKQSIKKIIGLTLIALGLGLLLSSIALNLKQYYSKKNTVEEFKEKIESGVASPETEGNDAVTGDMLYILRIPSIDSENPVREGTERDVLSDSLGHESGTAFAGEEGNCVIAGHRNYNFGKYFNRLDEVEIDDLIYLDSATETYTYVVTDIQVVDPTDVEILEPIEGKETLTLYTCTPIYIATQRLVIIAERVI
ncbi:class D sortase [Pseudobutyrivibrio ruminis]|uniref:Sortase A n=1 Tax=Pseudobutyrivibrio ruminis DSM 9787 TaxID=1123011 RepID=A0A285S3X0_9FIRM|nr:class D sortase [Pseudobutyrivibrio ruminis]SOC01330.1 sortase A [Pseudobutyrivibrio ruminis DSM 9787]